jgi:hypothetical protein
MTLDLRTLWHSRRTALLGGAAAVLVAGGAVGAVVATSSSGGTTVLAQVRAPLDTPAADDAGCGDGNGGEQVWSAGETDHLEISAVTGGCRNGTTGVTKDGVLFVMTFPDGHTFRSQG